MLKYILKNIWFSKLHPIGGIIVSVLVSRVADREFEPRSSQTKNYRIGMCCFSAKHAALRRKNKDWLARNQDNPSYLGVMSIRGLVFQWASTKKNKTKRIGLVQSGPHLIVISLKINLFSPWNSWKNALNSKTNVAVSLPVIWY